MGWLKQDEGPSPGQPEVGRPLPNGTGIYRCLRKDNILGQGYKDYPIGCGWLEMCRYQCPNGEGSSAVFSFSPDR